LIGVVLDFHLYSWNKQPRRETFISGELNRSGVATFLRSDLIALILKIALEIEMV
jgi:hypothetical protein